MAKRVVCVVGGAACLAALLANASATLKLALAGLEGGGWVAYALAPLAFLATFLFYLAPAALLPGAISRAWRGEGFDKPRLKDEDETAAMLLSLTKGSGTGSSTDSSTDSNAAARSVAAAKEADEKRKKNAWTAIGFVAMAVRPPPRPSSRLPAPPSSPRRSLSSNETSTSSAHSPIAYLPAPITGVDRVRQRRPDLRVLLRAALLERPDEVDAGDDRQGGPEPRGNGREARGECGGGIRRMGRRAPAGEGEGEGRRRRRGGGVVVARAYEALRQTLV